MSAALHVAPLAGALCCGCAGLGALGSNNAIVVVCKVFLADGAPSAFAERFSASSVSDDPTGVAETIGEEIIDEVLR